MKNKKSNTPNIDLEEMYNHYLDSMGIDESKISEVQRSEIKKAFVGGVGTFFVALTYDESSIKNNKDGLGIKLTKLRNEIEKFWAEEIKRYFRIKSKLN